MKRAAIVLGSYFLGGLALLFLSSILPKESTTGQWSWFLGLLAMAVPGFILAGLLIILPHEFGHVLMGKRLGFHFVGLKLLGFSWYRYAGRSRWRWNFDRVDDANRTLVKKDATLREIQLVLIAGPIASVIIAVLWSPLQFFEATKEFCVVAVVVNLLYALASLLPSTERMNDGAILLVSKKNPRGLLKRTKIHFDQTVAWMRPSSYRANEIQLTGNANSDCYQYMYWYVRLMDAGEIEKAGEYLKSALEIVRRSGCNERSVIGVSYESAVYFRRFQPNEELAGAADILCEKLSDPGKQKMVDGAKLWVSGDHGEAIKLWEATSKEYIGSLPKLELGTQIYWRDWFLRLRTEDMLFETDRLFVRPWRICDLDVAFDIYRRPEVMQYLGRDPKPIETIEDATVMMERWMTNQASRPPGQGAWAIVRKEDEKPIGSIMFKALPNNTMEPSGELEIGWHLNPDCWGFGYATEAAKAVAEYGFRMNPELSRVLAVTYPQNAASQKVAKRIGMTHLGISNDYYGMPLELFELLRT
jgi:RimJ/RimL family protein N-acetyltransferase